MKDMITKLINVETKISTERGSFNLFALFLRENKEEWDLLVSSKWINKDKFESIKYISQEVQNALDQEELFKISRIVVINCNDPEIDAINAKADVEHDNVRIDNSNFFGFVIRSAYIITSKKSCTDLKVKMTIDK